LTVTKQTSTNVLFHSRALKLTANPAPGTSSPSTHTNWWHLADPSSQFYTHTQCSCSSRSSMVW